MTTPTPPTDALQKARELGIEHTHIFFGEQIGDNRRYDNWCEKISGIKGNFSYLHVLAELERVTAERDKLRDQIPEGMKNCTIVFEKCHVGHGHLRGSNWVKHPCLFCENNKLKAERDAALKGYRAFREALSVFVDAEDTDDTTENNGCKLVSTNMDNLPRMDVQGRLLGLCKKCKQEYFVEDAEVKNMEENAKLLADWRSMKDGIGGTMFLLFDCDDPNKAIRQAHANLRTILSLISYQDSPTQ